MELAPIALSRIVESITPIDSNQTQHRHEYADTDTSRIIYVEWLELLETLPAIATFKIAQHPNGGSSTLDEWLTNLQRIAVKYRGTCTRTE